MNYPFDGAVFDLDGVITKTAHTHFVAWKAMFDEYLKMRESRDGEPFKEFIHDEDYVPYVDGKPRYQGVKSFLESRGINLNYGDPMDTPDQETVCGLGNKKNVHFLEVVKTQGAEVFESTVTLVKQLKEAGVHVGVASSSKNCRVVLEATNLLDLFETVVDGKVSAELGLQGKPEGDIFEKAARNMGVAPGTSIVFEDAISGVQAGRNGGFGLVVGVARQGNCDELLRNGADVAVTDLGGLSLEGITQWFAKVPSPLEEVWETPPRMLYTVSDELKLGDKVTVNPSNFLTSKTIFAGNKKPVFFLDYDGTLTSIVSRPQDAKISDEMKAVLERLAGKFTTAIVSGRFREDVQQLAKVKGIFYAGSHGFDICGPGFSLVQPEAEETIPLVARIIEQLHQLLDPIQGVFIEEKKFSVAAHYRLVEDKEQYVPAIRSLIENIIAENPTLRMMEGKMVFEILPAIDWNKGKAVRWIMQALDISWDNSSVIYIGDDTTDEDAFRVVRTRGTGVLVAQQTRPSAADFQLFSPDQVQQLFERLLASG